MRINLGDTIGIVAAAGECERESIMTAVKNLEGMGFRVKLSENIFDNDIYFAGDAAKRVKAVEDFFLDDEVKLILNARGGYGSIEILDRLNYDIIKSNPKPFCGSSDITALLLMIYKKTGIVTYHSPMASFDFGREIFSGNEKFSVKNFFDTINSSECEYEGGKMYSEGEARGIIWGGNLITVSSMCGLDFIPDKEFIFFAEEVNEPVYKIDRAFRQLLNIKKFRELCRGIVLGEFLYTDSTEVLEIYFERLSGELNIPVCGGFKITHGDEKVTIPIGADSVLKQGVLKTFN